MNIITKSIASLDKRKYYEKHLEIINPFLPVRLTPKRIEVLAAFMSLDGDLIKKDRFGTTARKIIKQELNLSNGGLGNYLSYFKSKGFVFSPNNDETFQIKEFLFPSEKTQGYQFKIIRK